MVCQSLLLQALLLVPLPWRAFAQDFAEAQRHYREAVHNGEIKDHPVIHGDLKIPDMDKLNKVIDPAVAPKAVNVLGKKGPVDPSKLDASNKTQLEPLVDWLKHDKQYKEEQKVLKKKADAAILHFQNSYKDMTARGIKGAAFDKSSLIEDAEKQRMKELPGPWRLWGSSGLLLVLGVAAAISLGVVCRRARVVADTVPLTDASDLEK